MLHRPVHAFLDVLERINPVKPRIEGAVYKDPIGPPRVTGSEARGNPRKSPYPVHHNPVEAPGILVQPVPEPRRKCIASNIGLAQGMNRTRNPLKVRRTGLIETHHLDPGADLEIGSDQLPHRFWRTAGSWRKTRDDMKDMQG
jgi:hypothetical protein